VNSNFSIEIRTRDSTPLWLVFSLIFLAVFTGWTGFLGIQEEESIVWIVSGAFILISTYLLVNILYYALYAFPTIIKLEPQGVEAHFIFGKYHIDWNEIENMTYVSDHLVIEGHNKTLTIPGWRYWGDKREEVQSQMETLSNTIIKQGKSRFVLHFPKFHDTKMEDV